MAATRKHRTKYWQSDATSHCPISKRTVAQVRFGEAVRKFRKKYYAAARSELDARRSDRQVSY